MSGTITISVIGDVRDLVAGTKTAKGELTGLSKVADRAGRAIKGSLVVGGAALVAFGVKSVKSASDAQQSIGATEAVFGRYADTVIKRSKDAADAVGLSANEYRELANVTGAMLASAGTPIDEVTDLTDKLTRRAADLAATFGGSTREAISAVGSLLRGEADPIERYGISIKQSDVNARLAAKGLDKLEGSARKQAEQQERLKLLFEQSATSAGQFADESNTLAGQQQRLGAKVTDLEAKFGTLLIPVLTEAAEWASEELVPALEDLVGWLEDNREEFADLGSTVKGVVLPPLKLLGNVVEGLVEFWGELPEPVRAVAVEAAIAAVVFPRLAAGVAGATAAVGNQVTYLRVLRLEMGETIRTGGLMTAMTRNMGGALTTVAGVGGMAALAHGATTGNAALTALGGGLSGAVLGAQIGSAVMPGLGTAIGGVGGAAVGAGLSLLGFKKATEDTTAEADSALEDFKNLKDTLDDVTGSITAGTRAYLLNELATSGALSAANRFGISQRDLISAALGNAAANARVNEAMRQGQDFTISYLDANQMLQEASASSRTELDKLKSSIVAEGGSVIEVTKATGLAAAAKQHITDFIGKERNAWREATREKRRDILALQDLTSLQGKLPKRLVTKVESTGIVPTTRGIARVIKGYKLTPEKIQTIIDAVGVDTTVRKVQRAVTNMQKAGTDAGEGYTDKAKGAVEKGSGKVGTAARTVVSNAERTASPVARTGGNAVGGDLASGVAIGISNGGGLVSGAAAQIIHNALAAMRQAADSHSPSRETMALGRDMGDGLRIGVRASGTGANSAGRALVGNVIDGMTKGASGVNAAIDRIADKYVKAYNRAHKKDLKPAEVKELNKALDAAGKTLAGIANQYAKTLELAKQTTAAAKAYASVTNLAEFGLGSGTGADGIVTGMQARLDAIKAFNEDLAKLAADGLNKDVLNQLLSAGVEGGAAYADALANGGPAALAEVNKLQQQINKASKDLGNDIAPKVTGLDPDKVQRAARRAANQIANILNRRLGVRIDVGTDGPRATVNARRTQINADAIHVRRDTNPTPIKVHLTAEQLSQLERGRRITADLTAYRKSGGR